MRRAFNSSVAAWVLLSASAAFAQFGEGTPPGGLDGGTAPQTALRCQECHDRESSISTELYMPYDGWVSSMMGNAMRDPLFLAALSVANQDKPGVGQWCLKCHSPQAWVRGHTDPPDAGAFDDQDFEGVTCDVCHRALPGPDGGFVLSNAQFYWELTGLKHGPYENISSPAHLGNKSPLTSDSALCGHCHQIENPFVAWKERDGGTTGRGFPLDTTYEEWKQSEFARGPNAQGCISCHMKVFEGEHGVAAFGPARTDPRRHTLTGGNLWGLKAVRAANPALAQYGEQFDQTEKFTEETLRSAAKLTVEAPANVDAGTPFEVVVKVENLTGHKLPTGYADGRRIFVELSVDGVIVSGRYEADGGELQPDPQLRVYEAFHGRLGVGRSEHLALHDSVIKDSRIPPRGMTRSAATLPVGVTWFDQADGGLSHIDEIRYQVQFDERADASTPSITVAARLLYQSTTHEYVDFLASENRTDDAGVRLKEIFRQTGEAAPFEIASASATVTLPVEPTPEFSGECGPNGCCCQHVAPTSVAALAALAAFLKRRRPDKQPGAGS